MAPRDARSVVWGRVLEYFTGSIAPSMVRASADMSRRPWILRLPSSAPRRDSLEAHLRTFLRARPVTAEDTEFYKLEIGELTIVNDTARVFVQTAVRRRCLFGKARTTGYGNRYDVFVVRDRKGIWGPARSAGVLHGDSAGC